MIFPAERRVRMLAAFFLAWAFLSTVTMAERYGYGGDHEVIFGLLKLAKFFVYGLAGWITIKLVQGRRDLDRLLWSLTVGGLVTASALPFSTTGVGFTVYDRLHGFKTVNAVSVEMAILILFLGVAWSSGWGGRWWQKIFPLALGAMTVGFAFSRGRGGWLAALIGLGWFLYRTSANKKRALGVAFIMVLTTVVAYYQVPEFRFQVDRTLNPEQKYLDRYGAGIMGIDEGGRQRFWWQEGRKLIDAPILGRGLFNRFPPSGLDWVGSHNFWLQMFLETGIPGGVAILAMWWIAVARGTTQKATRRRDCDAGCVRGGHGRRILLRGNAPPGGDLGGWAAFSRSKVRVPDSTSETADPSLSTCARNAP